MKKNMKRIIACACVCVLVLLLAVMPLIANQNGEADGPEASILSGTAAIGELNRELIGGGTLAEEDGVTVSVPAAVKLKKFLVSNGDAVTEGTVLATVDRVTVMEAISQVQETLEYLSEKIENAGDTDSDESVVALAGGIVKILYAEEGESVQNVMLEHGALAVLSLDGLMAVDLTTESTLSTGTTVTAMLDDGTAVAGKVVKNLAGEMTVTIEDDGYDAGQTVHITAEDGAAVGSGQLYIYSPWNATAYAGTVSDIKVSVGDKLSAGKTMMVLSNVGYSAAYRQLIGQRQEYEELMLDLFKMYQTETLTAPCDGVVSGIDKESVQLLSDNGKGYTITFLANAPNGNDQILYSNYVGKVVGMEQNGWSLRVNPQPIAIADYTDLSGVPLDESAMTQACTYPPASTDNGEETPPEAEEESQPATDGEPQPGEESDPPQENPSTQPVQPAPVYELVGGAWQQIPFSSVSTGDIVLFAADQSGEFVWIVRIKKANSDQKPSVDPGAGFPSGGMGGFPSGGMEQETFELYGLDVVQIAEVIPQSTMSLDITVDELDIRALQVGMTAQVKINALGGEKYTATISEIGNTGTNNGGNSKYTVKLTMERAENMLSGMNATATIVLSTTSDVLTIPADALVEQGNQTVVYTGYDAENDMLLDPVVVTVGGSDGETVEILAGLTSGQTYYYAYYDTLEISFTPDFGGGGFFGR